MSYLGISRLKFEETVVIFEVSTLEFLNIRSKQKNLKNKNTYI